MTTAEWFEQADRVLPKLVALVRAYHPATQTMDALPAHRITAGNAELACIEIRSEIRAQAPNGDPATRLWNAVRTRNLSETMLILNQAWFGVPESTSCWSIEGYPEAVALLEDPPEDEADAEREDLS